MSTAPFSKMRLDRMHALMGSNPELANCNVVKRPDGGPGTSWYSDPQEKLAGILMTQRTRTSPSPPDIC